MKRISLIFAFVCALILSLGISAYAQDAGSISFAEMKGIYSADTLNTKTPNYRFVLRLNNTTGKKLDVSNGWEIYSPDGAVWTNTLLDTLGPMQPDLINDPPDPDYCFGHAKYWRTAFGGIWNGDGGPTPDTVGYLGAGGGYAVGKTDTLFAIAFDGPADPATNDLKHICIDTAFWGVGGTWVWVTDGGATSLFPSFDGAPGIPQPLLPGYMGGVCFTFFNVPNLPPSISNCAPALAAGPWNSTFTYNFDATDPEGDPYTFELVSGPGSIDAATGVWTWNTAPCDSAGKNMSVVVRAKDSQAGPTCTMALSLTNDAPTWPALFCGKTVTDKINTPVSVALAATDPNGPPTVITYSTLTPGASIVGNNLVFSAAAEGTYPVTVTASDGCLSTDCVVNFSLLAGGKYWVYIEKTHMTIQGGYQNVNVAMSKAYYDAATGGMGGFNFLIQYDNSALSLQSVLTDGSAIFTPQPNGCGWEYFTYRFGADGNCTGGCPSGLVRVVGIAETNNGANHPDCGADFIPDGISSPRPDSGGFVMFTLKFLVSNDRTLNCQYVPIRFFWMDCTDNTISSALGNDLYIENDVYEYDYKDSWGNASVPEEFTFIPGYYGILQGSCDIVGGKTFPHHDIDFYNGGIDIACSDSIDARGDINLNGIGYEIADAVLFSRYFVYGQSVFTIDPDGPGGIPMGAGQVAATDVNADGLVLTVSDLVYLIRVVVGDALPYAKISPVTANYTHSNGVLSVNADMGAALVVVKGNVVPELLASDMSMMYNFDGANTRILVLPNLENLSVTSFTGDFLNVNAEIVSVEMASATGAPVVGKLIPTNYALAQNYPNPFNPSTKIGFALPTASDYSLVIYNVTGQKVAEFTGAAEAGSVEVEWNASGNASGIYFYKLTAGSFSATKKMVLLK